MSTSEVLHNSVVFGLDPLVLSTSILVITYGILLSEKVHRTIIALLGGGMMVLTGILTQDQAIAGVDFNTLALLTGMMIIVAVTRTTGVFEFVAIWSAKKVKASPIGVLLALSLVTAVFSAFLDNLTTVLLVVPIALLLANKLQVSPYPFLISQILASNIGGTATLIGDPPNILIGSATGLTFMQFLVNLGPIVVVILALATIAFYFIWGKQLVTNDELRARIMNFREADSITDPVLLVKCLSVLVAVILGFIIGEHYGIRPGSTALFGGTVLMLLATFGEGMSSQSKKIRRAMSEVEWDALFFFVGLFVVVGGVEHSGLLTMLGKEMVEFTEGDPQSAALATLWVAAIVSAAVDNIPFVATMIPMIESMEAGIGGADALEPIWWSLALGACLGGNGTLIGAAANVMVAGLGDRAGYTIGFTQFMMIGIPVMLVSVLISTLYIWLRYYT